MSEQWLILSRLSQYTTNPHMILGALLTQFPFLKSYAVDHILIPLQTVYAFSLKIWSSKFSHKVHFFLNVRDRFLLYASKAIRWATECSRILGQMIQFVENTVGCDHLSILGLKWINMRKRAPVDSYWWTRIWNGWAIQQRSNSWYHEPPWIPITSCLWKKPSVVQIWVKPHYTLVKNFLNDELD